MSDTPNEQCAALPSSNTALRVWQGDPAAFLGIARDLVFRGLLIGTGMFVIGGARKDVVKHALAGSAMIETFVLAWIGYERWQRIRYERQQQQQQVPPGYQTLT